MAPVQLKHVAIQKSSRIIHIDSIINHINTEIEDLTKLQKHHCYTIASYSSHSDINTYKCYKLNSFSDLI